MNVLPQSTSRRGFLSTCACIVASGTLSACASIAIRRVARDGDVVRLSFADYPELSKPGGSARILPEGAENPIYVLALGDNRYAALSPICTHRGCTVEIEGARLVCPCHGSTYDREGTVLKGPAERPLGRHDVVVNESGLAIRVSA